MCTHGLSLSGRFRKIIVGRRGKAYRFPALTLMRIATEDGKIPTPVFATRRLPDQSCV
jgi:hypothetical protein